MKTLQIDKRVLIARLKQPKRHIERLIDPTKPPAAVLVPIIERDSGLTVLFTQKTSHLRLHAGQNCFPGGRYETTDKDLLATALRETEEEIGVSAHEITIMGQLPQVDSVSGGGFAITPYVALVDANAKFNLDPNEVAAIFEVPLMGLIDPSKHISKIRMLSGKPRKYYVIDHPKHYIWGATAQIIVDLKMVLLG